MLIKLLFPFLGGPLIAYKSVTIPTPFLTSTYGYCIDSTLTGFGSLNITPAIYGNLQVESGVVKKTSRQMDFIPAVSITPVANIIYRNKDSSKFYPQSDINSNLSCHGPLSTKISSEPNYYEKNYLITNPHFIFNTINLRTKKGYCFFEFTAGFT